MSLFSEASAKSPSPAQPYKVAFYSLLVLVVAFAVCMGLQRGNASEAQAIQKVLEQRQALEREIKNAAPEKTTTGTEMATLSEKMKRLDIDACPPDFREAFIRLAGACNEAGYVLNKYPVAPSLVIDMGLKLLAGKKDAGVTAIQDELDLAAKELRIRQNEVDALAVRYGARLLHD